jgi:predicted NBD/HSP70 family sugar kinase
MEKHIGQPTLINKVNKDFIRNIIQTQGPISKPEIAKISKLSLPTVNKIVADMVDNGVIKKSSMGKSEGGGRRPVLYVLNKEAGFVIALYIENSYASGYIKGALVDILGNIIYQEDKKISYSLESKTKNGIFSFIDLLISKAKNKKKIKAICFGIPGVIDNKGTIVKIPNITNWKGKNIKKIISDHYKLPVFVENDTNLTAVGIFHNDFHARYDNMVHIYCGEGIGSGIILGKKLYKGKTNYAGEIASIITGNPERGKIEEYKRKGLFGHDFLDTIKSIINNKKISTLLEEDPENAAIFKNSDIISFIDTVSHMLINMTVLLNPEVITIHGPVFTESLLRKINENIYRFLDESNCPELMIYNDTEIGLTGTIQLGISQVSSNYFLVTNKGV